MDEEPVKSRMGTIKANTFIVRIFKNS